MKRMVSARRCNKAVRISSGLPPAASRPNRCAACRSCQGTGSGPVPSGSGLPARAATMMPTTNCITALRMVGRCAGFPGGGRPAASRKDAAGCAILEPVEATSRSKISPHRKTSSADRRPSSSSRCVLAMPRPSPSVLKVSARRVFEPLACSWPRSWSARAAGRRCRTGPAAAPRGWRVGLVGSALPRPPAPDRRGRARS